MKKIFSTLPLKSLLLNTILTTAIVAGLSSLVLTNGCASLVGKVVEKPRVELDHVSLKDSDLRGTTAVFVVKVENPNSVDLKVDDIAYRVFLSGQEFAKASTGKAVTVPAKGTSLVELPLPVEYSKILNGLQALLLSKPVDYRIEGAAKLSLFSIPFQKEGQLELR
jgi:LEA14-like dessication related protein